jgi:acyl-CoA thioester hydrolase
MPRLLALQIIPDFALNALFSGGVVYYANYLKFIERGRSEYLRDLGFEQDVLIAKHNTIFAVRRLNAQYNRGKIKDEKKPQSQIRLGFLKC